MDNSNRNFLSLKAEFHNKGKAARGYQHVISLIEQNKDAELKDLLRSHRYKSVYGEELIKRFEIDTLMAYYNLLLVSIFAGYIPGKLEEETRTAIITVLGHPSVLPYYETHYKDTMVSYALKFAKEDRQFEQEASFATLSAFNEFISLSRTLRRDKDLETFLGMLDSVNYGGEDITHVNEILSSYPKLKHTFNKEDKSNADRAVWGFLKYSVFLTQFKALLQSIEKYPLLQSSFWMFHGYYFDRMNEEMKAIFDEAFKNLEKTFGNPETFEHIATEVFDGEIPFENLDKAQLNEVASIVVHQAREDMNFVLNPQWGDALKKYFQ